VRHSWIQPSPHSQPRIPITISRQYGFPLLSSRFHPFHLSHHPIFSISTVPDKPSDQTTSQPDMGQQDVGNPKDRNLWHKICDNFKILCDLHKRERPLGEPPSVGQSVLAIIRTSCEPLILWHLHFYLTLRWSDFRVECVADFHPTFRERS
jgi:hypothetical protein